MNFEAQLAAVRNLLPDVSFQRTNEVKLLIADLTFQHSQRPTGYLCRMLPQLLSVHKRYFDINNMEDVVTKQFLARDQRAIDDFLTTRVNPTNAIVVTWTPSRPPVSIANPPPPYPSQQQVRAFQLL